MSEEPVGHCRGAVLPSADADRASLTRDTDPDHHDIRYMGIIAAEISSYHPIRVNRDERMVLGNRHRSAGIQAERWIRIHEIV